MDAKGYTKMKDQTLADYIKRTMENLERDQHRVEEKTIQDTYQVIPEDDGTDSKRNPYSNV